MEHMQIIERTAKQLKSFLSDIVFIELKTDHLNGIPWQREVPLPVYTMTLARQIKANDIETIPSDAIVKGLVTLLGADPTFKYNSAYIAFIEQLDPTFVQKIVLSGIKIAEEKRYTEALLYFNAALVLDEKQIDASFNMGRAYQDLYEANNDKKLLPYIKYYYEKTIELAPDFGLAYYALGFFYYNVSKYDEAEMQWLHALQCDITFEVKEDIVSALSKVKDRATYERGKEYILAGRTTEGLELLRSIEEIHDDWWELNFFIGLGLRLEETYEEALRYFIKTLNLNSGAIYAMNEAGVCLIAMGDYSEALKYYKEALRVAPENAEFVCNRGIVYYHMKDYDEAYNLIEHAHDLAPDDEVINMWYEHLKDYVNL
jgi:tetratricopeptide (TPR) repeat protein